MGKLRYLVPNGITLLSLTLGLLSIRYAILGQLDVAAWLVMFSVGLDKLDGTCARLLDARSKLGAELDSFADFVAFGVAPAFLLEGTLLAAGADDGITAWHAMALVYVLGCVLRLARFNVVDSERLPGFFHGFPSTLAGGLVASGVLVARRHGVDDAALVGPLALALASLGVAMVSPIYIPKVGNTEGNVARAATIVNAVVGYALIAARALPEVLFGQGVLYVVWGLAEARRRRHGSGIGVETEAADAGATMRRA